MRDGAYAPLPREEVVKAVERRNPSRVPLAFARWWGEGLVEQYGDRLLPLERYPEDVVCLWTEPVDVSRMNLSWEIAADGAHDSRSVIDDWAKLDEFIEKLPDPENDSRFETLIRQAEAARAQDLYLMFCWWRLFFERPWELRGMTTLLMDYYLWPEEVHRLNSALCDHYCRYLRVAIRALNPDAFFTSDDLGHQKQLFMRPETFREFLKPYYLRVGEVVNAGNLHWWLHSCGKNTPILEDLIEAGLDVFHPVQKGTMDEVTVAKQFGDRLTFLAGIDVQHILQERDPVGVREEVRFLIDTFDRPGGGMCIAAGNGIVGGTPFENIEAFLDEAFHYGAAHRRQFSLK